MNTQVDQQFMNEAWRSAKTRLTERLDLKETNIFNGDGTKIKPEIELKEESKDFVYKNSFHGHLQLGLDSGMPNDCSDENNSNNEPKKLVVADPLLDNSGSLKGVAVYSSNGMHIENSAKGSLTKSFQTLNCVSAAQQEPWLTSSSILHTSEDESQDVAAWNGGCQYEKSPVYPHLKNISAMLQQDYIKDDPTEKFQHRCSYVQALPEIYDHPPEDTWKQVAKSKELKRSHMKIKLQRESRVILLTQAEKKRLYRTRMKEENPTMWDSIKRKEAARKREQRNKRRQILHEMQKAMEFEELPNSPDAANNRLYLEALKERYPDLWSQLNDASLQMLNDQRLNEMNQKNRRCDPRVPRAYKDIIEAQKKRLYRQRIKEQHPEIYEKQKARDACARRVQRLMLKCDKNDSIQERFHVEQRNEKLSHSHLIVAHNENLQSMNMSFMNNMHMIEMDPVSSRNSHLVALKSISNSHDQVSFRISAKSDNSPICDNGHLVS